MKLDPKSLRYLTPEDWRTLTAVESGTRTHALVPTPLIAQLSGLRSGAHRSISNLAKLNLIAKIKNAKYDGYRLTYGGLDYLALHHHQRTKCVYSVGNQIGTGKESDILVVAGDAGEDGKPKQLVLKVHRLGRISFRTVKNNRDYLKNNKKNHHGRGDGGGGGWMHMSALAARKEYIFMKALYDAGFPVPRPLACNRHTVVMELVEGFPLRQIKEVPDPAGLYGELIDMVLRLAEVGLIHGDFNEFNVLIKEEEVDAIEHASHPATTDSRTTDQPNTHTPPPARIKLTPILIDFPQTLSIDHPNASHYFTRDINCIKSFFQRRFHFTSDQPGPFFEDAVKALRSNVRNGVEQSQPEDIYVEKESRRLDVEVEASGFSRKMAKELEGYMKEMGVDGDAGGSMQGEQDGEEGGEGDEAEEENEGHDDEIDLLDDAQPTSQMQKLTILPNMPTIVP